jgi:hypothetical protein
MGAASWGLSAHSCLVHGWDGVGGSNRGNSGWDTLGKKSGQADCCREMRAPDTGLGGAAAVAARWPEIGRLAERNTSLGLALQPWGLHPG